MHRFKFTPDDLFVNRLRTYPEYNVFIYQGEMHVNKNSRLTGSGGMVVYDTNRNRINSLVHPFVVSGSDKVAFKSQRFQPLVESFSSDNFWISRYAAESSSVKVDGFYGESFTSISGEQDPVLTSSYGIETPIKRNLTSRQNTFTTTYYNITASTNPLRTETLNFATAINVTASALQNVARKYTVLSDHFIFRSSSVRSRDLVSDVGTINYITIPNMYYGSTIKKGSVELNYYITGSRIASCADTRHDGTLIGTTGSTSGSIVGLVLYDEGVIMLTSSAQLDDTPIRYDGSDLISGSWQYFGTTLNDGFSHATLASASYDLNFKGVNYINSMTMFAHARKGDLNHSNNPTYRNLQTARVHETGSGTIFSEGPSDIANIVSGSYASASFDKTTYISKVHIYDDHGNLIAITSLSQPIKKTLENEFTLKMKLDL